MKRSVAGRVFVVVAALALQVGCMTPYQPRGFRGGFREYEVAERLYRITFEGNAFTSEEYVSKAVMLRAAEFCLARGYPYFETLEESTRSDRVLAKSVGVFASATYPGVTREKAKTTVQENGPLIFVTKHEAIALVRLLKEPEEGKAGCSPLIKLSQRCVRCFGIDGGAEPVVEADAHR